MTAPRLSPDASKVVLRMSNQGRDYLALIDLTNRGGRPKLFVAVDEYRDAGDRTVGGYRWVGNETVVFTLASREILGGGRADLTRLVAYNTRTERMTQLAWDGAGGGAANILHIDHARGHIMLERDGFNGSNFTGSEVVDVDVATGRYTTVQRPNTVVGGWETDAAGVVRLGSGYDRDTGRQRILYRSNASENFRTISNDADRDFTGSGIQIQWIDANSDMAIAMDNRSGVSKAYRVNLSTMEYSEPIFGIDGYDVGTAIGSFDETRIVGYFVTEAASRVHWVDPVYAGVQQVLDESFGVGTAGIVSRDATDRKFVVEVSRPNQAGTFYLFDSTTGDFGLIGHASAQLRDVEMNPVSAFRYNASDGVSIEAIMTMPRHRRQTTGLPLVILTHGGPFGVRDNVAYDGWAQSVAELGYVVVQPNYRGSGGYGREFVRMGRDNGFGLRMQDDLNDVITHLAGTGLIDPARVCMMGWSYGGYASARAAQRDADKYRCTIAGAGVYDLAGMRQYDASYLGRFGMDYLSRGAAALGTVSPTSNASGRWAPIMIVHGVRDQRVPISQGRGLVRALRAAGKVEGTDFEYIEQPQNTHNLPYEDVSIEWLEGAERWLTRWNPAYTPSDSDRPVPVVTALAGAAAPARRP